MAAAAALRSRRFKWSLDLGAAPGGRPRGAAEGRGPLGFADRQLGEGGVHESDKILMEKRCWDVALAPLKQIPMNLFIMYMAGNTISIFPAMMVCMMGWRPLQALMSLSASECSPHAWGQPRGHTAPSVSHRPKVPLDFPQPPGHPTTPKTPHSPPGLPQPHGAPDVSHSHPLRVTSVSFSPAQHSPHDAAHPHNPQCPLCQLSGLGITGRHPNPLCPPSAEGPGELEPAGAAGARVPGGQRAGAGTSPLQVPGHGAAAHPPLRLAGFCHSPAANGVHWGGPDLVTPCTYPPIKAMAGW